ncbi:uncharacterized protein LOC110466562 [Mizuhopecten yessoensis]|uniref:uncharacterized protein LOC110466562 n=1 Tax=Mizuhopecten yessoensis TaxID=6573 RepID=UPI000B45A7E4|nr:uncharacterized protein LOC110466562 [Mizuhopecten yessoensis]
MAVPRVKLPGTDIEVSRVCLGCWQFNGNKDTINWDAQTVEQSCAIVDKCLEIGVNFFDTAEGYAGSEEVLGKALKGKRDQAVVATKFGFRDGPSTPPYSPEQIDEAITKSLRKLEMSYVDLLQVHFPSFLCDFDQCIKELDRQIALGRIRSYGVSNFGPKNIKAFSDAGAKMVSNQMGYNLLWRSAEFDVIPECKKRDIGILAYSPLQQGLLSGGFTSAETFPEGRKRGKLFSPESCKSARHGQPGAEKEVFEALPKLQAICKNAGVNMAQASLAWILQQDNCPVVIVGARTPEQMVQNSQVITLPDSVVKEMSDVTDPVKQRIGRVLDQWAHPDRCE